MVGNTLDELAAGDEFPPVSYVLTSFMCSEYAHAMEDGAEYYYSAKTALGRQIRPPTMAHVDKLRLLEASCAGEQWLNNSEFQHARIHAEYSAIHHSPAYVGDELVITGRVADRYVKRGREYLLCEVWVRTADGRLVTTYTDHVALSFRPAEVDSDA